MNNSIIYRSLLFVTYVISFVTYGMDIDYMYVDEVEIEFPDIQASVFAASVNVVVKNSTNLNIALQYLKNNKSPIIKVIAPGERADLGLFSTIHNLYFFAFAKDHSSIVKKHAIPFDIIVNCYKNLEPSKLKDMSILINITRDQNKYLNKFLLLPTVNMLPPFKLNEPNAIEKLFPGLTSRADVPAMKVTDGFNHHYILGVMVNPSIDELKEAYNGLINQWTNIQSTVELRLQGYLNEIPVLNNQLIKCRGNNKVILIEKSKIEQIIPVAKTRLLEIENIIKVIDRAYQILLTETQT